MKCLQEPNPEDPLNKEAAEVLQNNRRVFEQNVAKAMRGGYVGSFYFERCLKWYQAGKTTLYTLLWTLALREDTTKEQQPPPPQQQQQQQQNNNNDNDNNERRRRVLVLSCKSALYILTFFTSCQASKHLIHQVFYAFAQ